MMPATARTRWWCVAGAENTDSLASLCLWVPSRTAGGSSQQSGTGPAASGGWWHLFTHSQTTAMLALASYTVMATPPGQQHPEPIGVMARCKGDAIIAAQELYPSWRVSAVLLEGEWSD